MGSFLDRYLNCTSSDRLDTNKASVNSPQTLPSMCLTTMTA